MKGTFFQKPLEFQLRVEGESWKQGETIRGTLEAKNHSAEAIPADEIYVYLVEGDIKKVRAKAAEGFEILKHQGAKPGAVVPPNGALSIPWSFATDRNFVITSNTASPFFVYGRGTALETLGLLQIAMQPEPLIFEFLDRFKVSYRFGEKSRKTNKGKVEVKLAPADSYASIEQAIVRFRFEGDTLEVDYQFDVTKMVAGPGKLESKKERKTFEQSFTKDQYLLPSGRVRFEEFDTAIGEAIKTLV